MPKGDLTFEYLATLDEDELEEILLAGTAPTLNDVVGCEFRGWNLNALTKILGTRKFIKGFFGDSDSIYAV